MRTAVCVFTVVISACVSSLSFRGESDSRPAESLCGVGFTFRLAPPMGTDAGLGLDEVLVLRFRESRSLLSSSRPDCPGLWAGLDWRGDFLPLPADARLPFGLGDDKVKRSDSGTDINTKPKACCIKTIILFSQLNSSDLTGSKLTLYSQAAPEGGESTQDVVNCDSGIGLWRWQMV